MAALRKLAAAATTSALLAAPARAAEAPADEAQAAELRAKLLALAAAQRERTDWEARRLHQLMRAVDEEHSRERAATLEKAAAEDAKAFAEERARTAEQRDKSDEAAAVRERAEARADVRRLLTEYDDALAAVWRGKVQGAESEAHGKARETLLAEIEAAANERDDAPRLQTAQELTQELEACTSKIATKMNRDERSAAALATARAGLRCAAALEGDQLDAGPCALLEAAVVRAAASGVRGAPSREKLAGRFKHRVEGPARAWLLVPDHADGVLGHAFAAAAAWLGVRGGVGGAGDDRRQARDELDAGARCLEIGDLSGAVRRLRAARSVRPASIASPLDDWLADAEARLKADQAASVVRAAVVLAQGQAAAEFAK
ncbi:unnamed protein product [Pelagomonas calceolata]|uniref:MICOS complex subunit MIC60 n=2 Tax=Pelagomonas calceolata TaxID=35677 RepID=A0A8J2SD79_9STRA|nr:unnamed protein product [Pelagomonas calceolata]